LSDFVKSLVLLCGKKMKYLVIITVTVLLSDVGFSQDETFISIHQEQSEYFSKLSERYNALPLDTVIAPGCILQKLVFGYHPYWMNNAYINYQWHLLTDIAYFSYEVDPETGNAVTTNNWETTAVVDSAQANGVRTHLCMTLFSGHGVFFNNPDAQQTLINNLINLVQLRNADGINLDFEAVPAAFGTDMVDFIVDLSIQYSAVDPEGMLSIAMPAVDWSDIFNVDVLKDHIDIFFIMGYDYYWNGSSVAGPITPLYPMTGSYQYSLSRTISYYQSGGMPLDKMVVGLPYYGRQWATQDSLAPSNVTGYGVAYKYRTIKNGSNNVYSPENQRWEEKSFSNYYSYYQNNKWYQCFLNEEDDLDQRYDIVNRRSLAGIGMWALGYDDGYTVLWKLIADNFTDCAVRECSGWFYDSGGPYWDHYNNEDYLYTIYNCSSSSFVLGFEDLSLETAYDSLWIYDGADTSASLIGAYSGSELPSSLKTSDSVITFRFYSDEGTTYPGWIGKWENGYLNIGTTSRDDNDLHIWPNPAKDRISFQLPGKRSPEYQEIFIYDTAGKMLIKGSVANNEAFSIDVSGLGPGIYLLTILSGSKRIDSGIFEIAPF